MRVAAVRRALAKLKQGLGGEVLGNVAWGRDGCRKETTPVSQKTSAIV